MTAPLDLARRASASPRWRWDVAGMRRLLWSPGHSDHGMPRGRVPDTPLRDDWDYAWLPVVPDLTDPATLGCIEHGILAPLGIYIERGFHDNSYGIADLEFTIMRGVVGDERRGRWVGAEAESDIVHPRPGALCVTLQDALVAALEAAP